MINSTDGQYPVKPILKGCSVKARNSHFKLMGHYVRDTYVLDALLKGESVGATPSKDNKWVLSIKRLCELGWAIYERDSTQGSTYFSLSFK